MKRIRYLTLLWMLFAGITGWAQEFNPTNPSEPGQLTTKLKLNVSPAGAGSTSGSGNYVAGTSVTVSASASTGWTFVNWTDANGEVVATTRSYTFTKDEKSEALTANFAFDPNGPGEPSELPHKLTLVAGEGGSVSGSGFYLNGTAVNIRAYANSYYDFEGWYDADGIRFSTEPTTTYTMGDDATTLTARFTFNPNSPSEPGEVNYLRLKLKAEEGGTVSAGKYNLKEGETTNVSAHANSGYVFSGWYEGETLVSETSSFTFTMGSSGTTLVARFIFSPSNPGEPDYIQQRKFSFTLKNAITKPGTTIQFPILLTPLSTLGDMTLQLNFDPRLNVDIDNVVLAETSTAYTLTREEVVEGDAAYDEGMTSYRFILTGGSMVVDENHVPTVTPILTFPVIIPEDIETASFYKISINQISMTTAEGTQTAGTRNGRVSVYKIGDANGDNTVDVYDYIGIANDILHVAQDGEFIREAGDVNDSGEIDVYDYMGVANIILYGTADGGAGSRQQTNAGEELVVEPE